MNITKDSPFDFENKLTLDPHAVAEYCGVEYAPLPTTESDTDSPMLIFFEHGGDPLPPIKDAVEREKVYAIHRVSIRRIYDNGKFRYNIFMRVFK